jgi:hypothetical protein
MTNTIHIFFTVLATATFATQLPSANRAPGRPLDRTSHPGHLALAWDALER